MKKINAIVLGLVCMAMASLAGTSGVLTYAAFGSTEIQITDCQTSASGTITIPATLEGKPVVAIGGSAFYNCSSITSIIIPDTLSVTISGSAFKNCTQLKRAVFKGDAPASFGSDVFDNTAAGFKIYYADDTTGFSNPWNTYTAESYDHKFSFKILSGSPETIEITSYPTSETGELDIPATFVGLSVTSIGDDALEGCLHLTRITLPDSITTIGAFAFYECNGLTTFTIPAAVTTLGDLAFGDAGLMSLFFKGDAPLRGDDVFDGYLPIIYYSNGAQGFDESPWTNTDEYTGLYEFAVVAETIKITSYPDKETGGLTIPETLVGKPVTRIGEAAFYGCDELTRITLPESLTSIYREAFELCSELTTVTIPTHVTSIGDRAYSGCSIDSVFFEGNNPSMGSISLGNATGLTVYYRDGNTNFTSPWNGYTTEASTGPLSFTVTEEEVSIIDCLTSESGDFIIPAQIVGKPVVALEPSAFYQCNNLTRISIPSTVTTIDQYAFSKTDALTEYSVASGNPIYSSVDGVLFNKTQTQLLNYPEGKVGDYVVPDTVTSIAGQAFYSSDHLYSVVIPKRVTTIDSQLAFGNCTRLQQAVFLGNAPSTFPGDTFNGTAATFKIYYPEGKTGFTPDLKGYPTENFDGKFSLKIHSSYSYFPPHETLTQSVEITDYPQNETGEFNIPSWLIGLEVQAIGPNAFEGSANLTLFTIPAGVRNIGDFAFYNCINLQTVIFEGDTPILEYSFGPSIPPSIITSVFDETDLDFMIYYFSDHSASGFSSPLWEGYPSTEINLDTRPLALWLIEYGIAHDADIGGDLNGDGVSLLMNYALNLDPTQNQAGNTPQLEFDNPQPGVISIWYYATQANVTYTVDTSTDLEIWTTNGVTLTPLNGNYRAAWVPQTGTHQFLRLRVEAATP